MSRRRIQPVISRGRILGSAMTVTVMVLAFLTLISDPAAAATSDIAPPFDIGQTWNICQGYGGPVSHTGTSLYGLDLTGAGCDNSAAGRNVRAPFSGTVSYWQASYGNLCVNISGNRSYTLTHIEASVTSGSVTASQLVGTVAPARPDPQWPQNNNLAHIHFQIWGAPNCYNSSVIPFDTAHGTRICGAPDLTATGPNGGNGTWSGTSFTGTDCNQSPSGYNMLGDFNGDGRSDLAQITPRTGNSPSGVNVSILLSTGSGMYNAGLWYYSTDVDLNNSRFVPGDFNGDGKTDLAQITPRSANNPSGINITVLRSTGSSLAYAGLWFYDNGVDLTQSRFV